MKKIFAIILAIFLNTSISYSKIINEAYFAGGFVSGMILILFFNKKTKRKNKILKGPWG